MLNDFLTDHGIKSKAQFVEYGYGQVEPNHLSAQRNAQIYAQLPAADGIDVLEQGQFVKYDYGCKTGPEVNFEGPGEWMLVYNEIKLYRDGQNDCEFALVKDNYNARVYSPFGSGLDKNNEPTSNGDIAWDRQSRYFNGVNEDTEGTGTGALDGNLLHGNPEKVTTKPDPYEMNATEDPFHFAGPYTHAMMKKGTKMVPRVFKTMPGDIMTTNTINETSLAVGDLLRVGLNGILVKELNKQGEHDNTSIAVEAGDGYMKTAASGAMRWQVVKVYTMPDHQRGAKIMRIA